MESGFSTLIDFFQMIAGIATAGAFIYAAKAYTRSKRTEQLKIAESIFKDIRDLDHELSLIKSGKENDKKEDIKNWCSRYFNTIEWMSFLVNKNEMGRWVTEFFKDVIVNAYDNIYVTYYDEIRVKNEKEFPEFKKLYHRIKSGCYDERRNIFSFKH